MIDVFVKTSQVVEDERVILSYTRVRTLICTQKKKTWIGFKKLKKKRTKKLQFQNFTCSFPIYLQIIFFFKNSKLNNYVKK
jgi:hypothetical protein